MAKHTTKFIFITGGVVSSLGKGIAASSIAALLQCHGYKVKIKKLDPYLNVDPGTMSPTEHGEVFVTDDGCETDLDLGHYERFTALPADKNSNTTAGKIYLQLLTNERRGDYLGETVQVIPHVTDLIKEFILTNSKDVDFVLCEIGGTVGDIEAEPFIESLRQLNNELPRGNSIFIHLTLIPYLKAAKELKTKPTQHSVKELSSRGVQPNILICRTDKKLKQADKTKIALFCNVKKESVFEAMDQHSIYNVVLDFHKQKLDQEILLQLGMRSSYADVTKWEAYINKLSHLENKVKIAIITKYHSLKDSYKSLSESLIHASVYNNANAELLWVDSSTLTLENIDEILDGVDAILVPGGFGTRGIEGKLLAIQYARENNIAFFAICLGMQLAIIEFARNVLGIKDATSSEFDDYQCANKAFVICKMSQWSEVDSTAYVNQKELGGTMRLGAFDCKISDTSSLAYKIYQNSLISERHRHRYEFNIDFKSHFENSKMAFSGTSADGNLIEIIELQGHSFFIGVQFHPELKSNPFHPHPIFQSFIASAIKAKHHKGALDNNKINQA